MGAGGSFEYVAKVVEDDSDLEEDERDTLARYVREHKITGKRAKRRFVTNDPSALEAIAGRRAAGVCLQRLRQKQVQVGHKAEEFFANVKDFIAAKHEIDEVAERVLPRSYMDAYPSFKPEVLRHKSDMSLDEVYASALHTRPAFESAAYQIVCAAGLDPDEAVTYNGEALMLADDVPLKRLCVAPPKGHARAAEKISNDYAGDASRLVDVNRCSVVVDEEKHLVAVVQKLMEGRLCEVVRLKNRFAEPLFNGYRDALYSVRIKATHGDVSHVCELQLHLAAVIAHKEKTHHYYEYFRSYFAGSMSEVDSRMRDLMDIGISHDKSLEGLVNDLAAASTDVPRLKGLARFLGYGGMDEYELAARLYDRCLDVHLTALQTARLLWKDPTATAGRKLRGVADSNALKDDAAPVEALCRAQLEAADNMQWHGSEAEEEKPTCCAPEVVEAWEAQKEAWRKAGALFRETRDRAASKLGADHPVCLKATAGLAGWILEDKHGAWDEAFALCNAVLPELTKVKGAQHPDTLDARAQLAQIYWSAPNSFDASAHGFASGVHAAAALFEENILIYADMAEPDHEHRLMNMTQLARVYNEELLARHEDGLKLLEEALDRYRRTLGEANDNTLECSALVETQEEGLARVAAGEPFADPDDDRYEYLHHDEEEDDEEDDDDD